MRLVSRNTLACAVTIVWAGVSAAQEAQFEVATIKPAEPGTRLPAATASPDRFYRRNATLRELVAYTFDVSPFRVVDGPEWVLSRRWEVSAKARLPVGTQATRGMVRGLLEERFALRVHRQRMRLPGFQLELSRTDRRLGPGLTVATGTCRPFLTGERSLDESPRDSQTGVPACLGGVLHFGERTIVRLSDYELSSFVQLIENEIQRPVVDATGLQGLFDISLDYRPFLAGGLNTASDAPALMTALQESLGLRLRSGTVDADVVVIDAASLPTPN